MTTAPFFKTDTPPAPGSDGEEQWLPNQRSPDFTKVNPGMMGKAPPGFAQVPLGNEAVQAAVRAGVAKNPADYVRKLAAAATLLGQVKSGAPGSYRQIQAAFSTSDFDYFFVDILNRSIVAQYRSRMSPFRSFFARRTAMDFREVKIFQLNWDNSAGELPLTREQELPRFFFSADAQEVMQIVQYQAATSFDWRVLVNDNLDALMQLPQMITNLILLTEGVLKTRIYATATGGNAAFFTAANSNLLAANTQFGSLAHSRLTLAALQAAETQMLQQEGPAGEDLGIEGVHLVIPDGLTRISDNILSGSVIAETGGGDDSPLQRVMLSRPTNIMRHVDPYLKKVLGATLKNNAWMLVADPAMTRPAFFYLDFMPQPVPYMLRRLPMYEQIGGMGGAMEDTEYVFGFFTDQITYDHRMAIWSNGTA